MKNLNKSSYAILGLLSKANMSGYALKRIITKTSSFYCSESNAQIYPVLKKLEQQNLVNSALDKSSGARNKRIFAITKKGQTELMNWLKSDCDLDLYREEFLLQLSLGQHLSHAELIKKIHHYQKSAENKLEKLNEIEEHLKTNHANKKDQRFLLLTYDHIKTLLKAKLQWCDKILKNL